MLNCSMQALQRVIGFFGILGYCVDHQNHHQPFATPGALLCISMSTVALGLSFIFGNLLKEIFESVVLLLVMHPYDVGDRIQLGDGDALRIYTVQKPLI